MTLSLSIAVGDTDRVRPLVDGTVQIDGVTPTYLPLEPEEIFFRAFRHEAFDVAELSLSSTAIAVSRGTCPYVGVPVFPSRAFRHAGVFIRKDRGIRRPEDLAGRKVGLAEYQLTANVWIRAFLEDDFGVTPASITWVRGGIEEPGRPEKISVTLPAGVAMIEAPAGRTLSAMLEAGEIDALIGPRTPGAIKNPNVGWLFDDPRAASMASYRKSRIFPIMHLIGVRRSLAEQHPWLPGTIFKAFNRAKAVTQSRLADTAVSKVMLPFIEQQLVEAEALFGPDIWPYGLEANRHCLAAFLATHHRQGLSTRLLSPDELFHPSTAETTRI